MSDKKIGVIGSLNVDYDVYVKHAPAKGETILADEFSIVPGGKGANQAFALGRIGCDVVMFGIVGDDANGALELQSLRNAGVDTSHVERSMQPTGLAMITIAEDGDNSIVVVPGANRSVDIAYINRNFPAMCECDIIIFQLEIPIATVLFAAKKLKEAGKIVILDPAPVPEIFPDELLQYADYVKPNEKELAVLAGMSSDKEIHLIEESCRRLLDKGANCVLASAGPDGAFCMGPDRKLKHFPSYDVPVIDTTAAGDSFTASFAYGLSQGFSFDDSVRIAVEISTIVVQRKGAQSSIPDAAEMEEIIGRIIARNQSSQPSQR